MFNENGVAAPSVIVSVTLAGKIVPVAVLSNVISVLDPLNGPDDQSVSIELENVSVVSLVAGAVQVYCVSPVARPTDGNIQIAATARPTMQARAAKIGRRLTAFI
jgi:hypothetical protein